MDEKQEKDANKNKMEDDKKKKEEEKKKKEDEKKKKKEDEKKKKEDEKKQKEDDKKQKEDNKKKEDEKKQKKEEEKKKKEDDKKQKKEEEKKKKDDAKKKKEEEKQKKKAEKAKNKKKTGGCCSCRAGVCRCWYCCWCHCLLHPLLWLYGMILLGFSLYYALKFTLEVEKDQQEDNLMFLYWGTFTYALLFVILVQMTYLLVLFESTNKCGIILFTVLFAIAFILCFVVLIFSIFCPEWCPQGKERSNPIVLDIDWRAKIPDQVIHLLLAAAVTLALMIFLLHIYLYNTLQFIEEKELRENKDAYCCNQQKPSEAATVYQPSNVSVVGTQPSFGRITKYHTEGELNNYNNNSFASIARRYRSISYERSAPTRYVGSTYMGMNTQFSTMTYKEHHDSTC